MCFVLSRTVEVLLKADSTVFIPFRGTHALAIPLHLWLTAEAVLEITRSEMLTVEGSSCWLLSQTTPSLNPPCQPPDLLYVQGPSSP